MARLVILVTVIAIALILWFKIKQSSGKRRKQLVLWSIIGGVIATLALLAVTGHLNVITAGLAAIVAALPKLINLVRYLPIIDRLYKKNGQPHADQQRYSNQQGQQPGKKGMSTEEAMEILALKPGYARDDVIQAHRRMMQKVHPDRGGSDYLAAQINKAKDTLLG